MLSNTEYLINTTYQRMFRHIHQNFKRHGYRLDSGIRSIVHSNKYNVQTSCFNLLGPNKNKYKIFRRKFSRSILKWSGTLHQIPTTTCCTVVPLVQRTYRYTYRFF